MSSAFITSTISDAEHLLSGASDADVRLKLASTLQGEMERHLVIRCESTQASGVFTQSVIIKRASKTANSPEADMLINEWASLQFLGESGICSDIAPRFLCGDVEAKLIVVEDLGSLDSLVEPLLGHDRDRAEEALVMFARRLGKVHAGAFGKSAEFEHILSKLGGGFDIGARASEFLPNLNSALDHLNTSPGPSFYDEVQEVMDSILKPGPFYTFVHGDPCPDNCLISDGNMHFIDFETAGFRNALVDGVYGRMMFPSCWCASRIPKTVVETMEITHHRELAKGCVAARDDKQYRRAIVDASAFWLLVALVWYLPKAVDTDADWGISTMRQRISARLEAFIAVSEEYGHLSGIRRTARALSDALGKRWPSEVIGLSLYPAFR